MEISSDGKVAKFCGVQGCCPTLSYVDGGVTLQDDHGGLVRLTSAEWGELVEGVRAGLLR